jgi:hypothetical protein
MFAIGILAYLLSDSESGYAIHEMECLANVDAYFPNSDRIQPIIVKHPITSTQQINHLEKENSHTWTMLSDTHGNI